MVVVRQRSVFCGTVPRVTPGGRYPPPCPVEPGPSSAPTQTNPGAHRGRPADSAAVPVTVLERFLGPRACWSTRACARYRQPQTNMEVAVGYSLGIDVGTTHIKYRVIH
jgi:hypothetical protein